MKNTKDSMGLYQGIVIKIILFFFVLIPHVFVYATAPSSTFCDFSGIVKEVKKTTRLDNAPWAEVYLIITQSSCEGLKTKDISVRVDYITEHGQQFYSKEELIEMGVVSGSIINGSLEVYEPVGETIKKTKFYDMYSIEVVNKGGSEATTLGLQDSNSNNEVSAHRRAENILIFSLVIIVSLAGIVFVVKKMR